MKGKCNCGKKAVAEFLITRKKTAWSIFVCENCRPKDQYNLKSMQLISGK